MRRNWTGFPFLRPVFVPETGTITKGNGAKINDGAAALVLGKESSRHRPIARIVGYASHSQSPATFAIAPVEAIKKVLKKCGLKTGDIDLFEINEAFAAASLIVNDRFAARRGESQRARRRHRAGPPHRRNRSEAFGHVAQRSQGKKTTGGASPACVSEVEKPLP